MDPSATDLVLENRPLLCHEREYGALICLICNNVFPRNRIVIHLNHRHGFAIDLYHPILGPFECEALADDWGNLHHPADGLAPIEGSKSRTGYACMRCGHRTTSPHITKGRLKSGGESLLYTHTLFVYL